MDSAPESAAAKLLSQLSMFAELPAPALAALARHTRPFRYQPGAELFREGEACAGVFIIAAGTVRIFKLSPAGRELTIHIEHAPAAVHQRNRGAGGGGVLDVDGQLAAGGGELEDAHGAGGDDEDAGAGFALAEELGAGLVAER